MDVRLVVCFDFNDVESLKEAYIKLRNELAKTDTGYETSDEFFIDGELGDPNDLDEVCLDVVGSPFDTEQS